MIYARLRQIFDSGDWDAILPYLSSLSNAHFRTAGFIIGERMLTGVAPDIFWDVATRLILWHPKAFTVTLAKAAAPRLAASTLSLADEGLQRLATALDGDSHLLDRQKLLMQWLPVIAEPADMEQLFDLFHVSEPRRRVEFLLRTEGITSAFVLLRTLRFEEHDRQYLTDICRQIIRRASTSTRTSGHADSLSYNLASLLRTYFDLPDLRGIFSLTLQPYELSRLDTDFQVFKRIITKV